MLNQNVRADDQIVPLVVAVMEADQAGTGTPGVLPDSIIERFNALASGLSFTYKAFASRVGWLPILDATTAPDGEPSPTTAPASALGLFVDQFVNNTARDRFRQCPICGKFFADKTRNRSAVRCSRACTIVWSTRQRALQQQARRGK
jgi:predicted RNA-binding Zn ribbon-like protein